MALVRVQVLIEEEENAALVREARRLRVSKSEVVRRSLRPLVEPCGEDPFFAMIGTMPPSGDGEKDVARRHDEFIYTKT